jgi:hypothetical protein
MKVEVEHMNGAVVPMDGELTAVYTKAAIDS